jgi:hypothetical protein
MKKLNIKSVNELDPNKVYKIKVGETLLPLEYTRHHKLWFVGDGPMRAEPLIEWGCEVYEIEPEPTVVVEFEAETPCRVFSDGQVLCEGEDGSWDEWGTTTEEDALISAFLKKIAELEARGEQS